MSFTTRRMGSQRDTIDIKGQPSHSPQVLLYFVAQFGIIAAALALELVPETLALFSDDANSFYEGSAWVLVLLYGYLILGAFGIINCYRWKGWARTLIFALLALGLVMNLWTSSLLQLLFFVVNLVVFAVLTAGESQWYE